MSAFATVLHDLRSPVNVGTIVRSHVAFGGSDVVFVGLEKPWRFKRNTQAFSRRLERICDITYLKSDDEFFAWCADSDYSPIAIEISSDSMPLPDFRFPERPALVVGNEGQGLSSSFLSSCSGIAVIPQFGDVACLNAGVSAAVAMYEFQRSTPMTREIVGGKFLVPPERQVSPP